MACRPAIGAKLAAPDRPVVVLVGDGGLQFTIGELAAAVEAKVGLIVLLWNNEGYGEIKTYMVERQIRAHRRRYLHARLPRHRQGLRLPGGAGSKAMSSWAAN